MGSLTRDPFPLPLKRKGTRGSPPVLAALLGPGTFISGLHAANKALICWCADARLRETIVKVYARPNSSQPHTPHLTPQNLDPKS